MTLKKILTIHACEFRMRPEFIGRFIEAFAEQRNLVSKKLAIGRCGGQIVNPNWSRRASARLVE
jgi:hypothetical protein